MLMMMRLHASPMVMNLAVQKAGNIIDCLAYCSSFNTSHQRELLVLLKHMHSCMQFET